MIEILKYYSSKVISHGVAFFAVVLLFYFSYHAFFSERNVLQLYKLSGKIDEKKQVLEELKQRKDVLQNRANLLYTKTLDRDMLDEQARLQLGFMGKNEVMIFVDK